MNPIQETQRLGQATWIDYIRRSLLRSDELQRLIERGIKDNGVAISRLANELE